VALLQWIARGIIGLLGYRYPTTLRLNATSLELRGERRFMGLSLGHTCRVVPLPAVEQVDLAARSTAWAVVAAVVALVIAAAIGVTLVVWV